MNKKKKISPIIEAFGNGSKNKVERNSFYTVYCNTSFIRLKNFKKKTIRNLILSDAYCDLRQIFDSLETNKKKIEIRKKKIELLKNLYVNNLIIFSNFKSEMVRKNLKNLKINFKSLKIVSPRKFYCRLLVYLCKNKSIDLKLTIIYFFSILLNKKPPNRYRPSNGVMGAFLFFDEYKIKVKFDGFLSKKSYYDLDSKGLNFYNIHQKVDLKIINLIKQ